MGVGSGWEARDRLYLPIIGGRKGWAVGLQPHLILRVLYRIIFYHRNIFLSIY